MTSLGKIVEANSYRTFKTMIEEGEVTSSNLPGALFYACKSGYADSAVAVLESGISPDIQEQDGTTPLIQAVKQGHQNIVQLLISWDCDVNVRWGGHRNNALHESALRGQVECCRLLLDCGVDVNARNSQDDTPLIMAAHSGNVQLVRLLLSRGASVRYRGYHDRTALHVVSENGHVNCCQIFLSAEADIEADDAFGHTPLISAAEKGFVEPTRLLLTHGADVNNVSHSAATALHFAAQHGNTECCKLLLLRGAEIDAQDIRRYTPLMMASLNGHSETVSLLVEWKSNVNMAAYNRRTALHLAAERGKLTCSSILLEAESQIDAQDSNLCTPVHLAASRGHADVLQFLIESGSDLDKKTTNGNTLLHMAAIGGNVDCCKLVMEKGFGLNLQNHDGDTPLISAVSNKQIRTVQFLLDSGCNVNVRGKHGMTALNEAVFHHCGSEEIIKTLLRYGADPDIPDDVNTSPLWFAVDSGNTKIIRLLLQINPRLDQKSSLSPTCGPCSALEHSAHKQNKFVLEALSRVYNEEAVNSLKTLLQKGLVVSSPHSPTMPYSTHIKELTESIASSTASLTDMCRRAVRRNLGIGQNINARIATLSLPKSVRNFLLLEDLEME